MPYITIKQAPAYKQISFEDIMAGVDDLSKYVFQNTANTRTIFVEEVKETKLEQTNLMRMIAMLSEFNRNNEALFKEDRASLYRTFHIPKNKGGLRRIDAPNQALMTALRNLKVLFETELYALYHTSAFAYVKNRSTVCAIKRHQNNESKWFLKIDFENFFGSTTQEFVLSMLSNLFPFSEIMSRPDGKEHLSKAVSLCFLNGGLPQGTPISPTLTNLMMIPIDHKISNTLRNFDNRRFVYTRYADDLIISCKYDFDKSKVQKVVENALKEFNAPFCIKADKTRYGSSAGKNWNLGIMLNKDNEMTIGHKKKKAFKAMIDNYIKAKQAGEGWGLYDVQVLAGLISYYRMIEKSYIDYVLHNYSEKNNIDIEKSIKADLVA